MRETYYKIGKTNNYFVVFKINEVRGKNFIKNITIQENSLTQFIFVKVETID